MQQCKLILRKGNATHIYELTHHIHGTTQGEWFVASYFMSVVVCDKNWIITKSFRWSVQRIQ
jgi:hypothetical protein